MLIGLNGFKNAGKDTVADFLVRNHGFEKISFAASLKESAAALFEIDPSDWDEYKNDDTVLVALLHTNPQGFRDDDIPIVEITARKFLQRYGTEAHRSVFYDDFWIDALLPSTQEDFNEWIAGRDVVITDARFPNELMRIRALGGKVVQVIRPALENNDEHVSEQAPDPKLVDVQIANVGSLEDLEVMTEITLLGLRRRESEKLTSLLR